MKPLAEYTHEEQQAMPYTALCKLRRYAFAAHIKQMHVPNGLQKWARKMEFKALNSGDYDQWCEKNETMPDAKEKVDWAKTCGVWANRVPWITALMVVRYGEEPEHWPAEFSDDDIERAQKWHSGESVPDAVLSAKNTGV